MSTPPSAHRTSSRRRRAPPRAFTGVATGAFRAEQRSLETAFSELDSNVIASVLERRNGNADLAAADLLEMKATTTVSPGPGGFVVTGSGGKRARTDGGSGDAAYWGSVLERRDDGGDGDDDAMVTDGSSRDASSGDGRTVSPGAIGWATYEWDDATWAREPRESVRLSECEALVGWRRCVETTAETEEGNEENVLMTTHDAAKTNQPMRGVEMLVKWRGLSHAHCSWASVEAIETDIASGPHGKARVGRFFDKHPMEAGPFVSVKPDYVVVDRVFSKFEEQERTLVCVKWASLGYDETTWEEESYVRDSLEGGAAALERFEKIRSGAVASRERQRDIEAETADQVKEAWKSATADAVRERYGHSYRLRSYQEEGVKWMAFNFQAGRGCILADEMGLGKTAQALALINYTLQVRPGVPALIVVPLSTIINWEREAKRWVPDAHLVTYVGKQAGRDFAREHEWYHEKDPSDEDAPRGIKANIVLTTYETVTADRAHFAKVKWSAMVIDEAHRLKRVGGKLGNDLNSLSVERTCLLTGTPLQNNTAELWSLLNFIDAKHFSTAEDFEAAFGGMAKAAQVQRLQKVLGPYLLRRLKCDVEQKLPPRSETLVECELAPLQKKCYRALFERNFSFLRQGCDSRENFANFANIMMEVRKCCQHPFLLDGVEAAVAPEGADPNLLVSSAGKLQLLDKLLPHLKEGDHRALIFSQMTRVLDVLEDYCRARGHSYVRLDGSITGKARQEAIDKYCNEDSDTVFVSSFHARRRPRHQSRASGHGDHV
jgi:chromodomain-helicase-DNA-binding protein 6